jgi:hypothetical protein
MKKEIESLFPRTTRLKNRNGMSSMLMKPRKSQLRDLTKTMVSKSTDHSTSDQECQCTELLNALDITVPGSRIIERMLCHNNGTSTKYQRPSRICNGRLRHLISITVVEEPI